MPTRLQSVTLSDDRLAAVAERAARAGGEYLADAFRDGPVTAEYSTDDVQAAVDREAQRRVVSVIRDQFPDHVVHAEEAGQTEGNAGDRRARENQSVAYEWFVDPLDGTNNFTSDIPTFATAVAVTVDGRPRAAAIHEPVPGDLYLARRGAGATVNGDPLSADSDLELEYGTVSFAVGLTALRDPALRAEAERMETALEGACRRLLRTWAPCVDWGLLARGGIEGLVAFHSPPYERYAGKLLAAESGVRTAAGLGDELYVGACNEQLLTELRAALQND